MLSDEEYGAVLLRPLADEPRQPSTVDIGRALAEGRRRRRRRRLAGYAASGALAVVIIGMVAVTVAVPALDDQGPRRGTEPSATGTAAPEPAPAAVPAPVTACTVERLALPGGPTGSGVEGGSPNGRYLVGLFSEKPRVVFWDNRKPVEVPMPGTNPLLVDVNDAGVAVGYAWLDPTGPTPFAYVPGGTPRSLPGGRYADARAINSAGVVVGNDLTAKRPVIWRSRTADPTPLAIPAGALATAEDIDDDGTVVGTLDGRPYVWEPDGGGRFPLMPRIGTDLERLQIRNGWLITRTRSQSGVYLMRWNLRTGDTAELRQFADRKTMITAFGWFTGYDEQMRATLTTPTATLVLPALNPTQAGLITNTTQAISDDGRMIAGETRDPVLRVPVAVAWNCS